LRATKIFIHFFTLSYQALVEILFSYTLSLLTLYLHQSIKRKAGLYCVWMCVHVCACVCMRV